MGVPIRECWDCKHLELEHEITVPLQNYKFKCSWCKKRKLAIDTIEKLNIEDKMFCKFMECKDCKYVNTDTFGCKVTELSIEKIEELINNYETLQKENEDLKLAYHDLYHDYLNDTIKFDWRNMENAEIIQVLEKALEIACDELLKNGVTMHDKCIYQHRNCIKIDCFDAIKDTFISKAKEELEKEQC